MPKQTAYVVVLAIIIGIVMEPNNNKALNIKVRFVKSIIQDRCSEKHFANKNGILIYEALIL